MPASLASPLAAVQAYASVRAAASVGRSPPLPGRRPVELKDLLGQVNADDGYVLHSSILLIQSGPQWDKCRQEGLPNPSSTPQFLFGQFPHDLD